MKELTRHAFVCMLGPVVLIGLVGLVDTAAGQSEEPVVPLPPSAFVPAPPEKDEAKKPGEDEAPTGTSEVHVSEFMTVNVIVQNDDITNVLHKLAIQARRNIVPSDDVSRIVNATIYDVPFYEALEGLLLPNGLGYVERGDFIFVYTNEELATLSLGTWQPVTRIIHLDYLRSADARDYVLNLLSPVGHISITHDIDVESAVGTAPPTGFGGAVTQEEAQDEVYTPDLDEFALTNSIIVQDYEENVDRIESFLRELDTPPAQVLIEATIIQTRLGEANAFGVDFALLTDTNFVDFFNAPLLGVPGGIGFKSVIDTDGNLASPLLPNREGYVISNPGNTGQGDATIRAGYTNDDVGVFIRALDKVTDVTLLSNPKILALNRQRAKVFVGTKVGYLETIVVENQVLQTVKFIDTGIILDIRPYILQDGRIRLELAPKVSDVTFRQFESSDGTVQEIPDERLQTVSTDVLVPAGHTAIIGGLFREDTTRTRSQVPVLGDIPVVGGAFRGHDDSTEQAEIIFLIKPTILKERVIVDRGAQGKAYGERVRVGSRLGLLPWSRERQTARLNLRAERLLAEGRPDEALHRIRRSLELHPQQPEVIRMQQKLVSDPMWWPTRSYMERMIDEEFGSLGPRDPSVAPVVDGGEPKGQQREDPPDDGGEPPG